MKKFKITRTQAVSLGLSSTKQFKKCAGVVRNRKTFKTNGTGTYIYPTGEQALMKERSKWENA